jgi:fatty-acyl-CoA synthase
LSISALLKTNNITAQVESEFDPQNGQVVNILLSNRQEKEKVAKLLIAFPVLVNYINL